MLPARKATDLERQRGRSQRRHGAHGAGYFALDKDPVVFQVPDFGNRFWVYALYDARTDEIAEIGKPYGTKPGFYMMVGPNWKGQTPAGITAVVRSSTELGLQFLAYLRKTLPKTRRPFSR